MKKNKIKYKIKLKIFKFFNLKKYKKKILIFNKS